MSMTIQRRNSRLTFRARRRRWTGCLPITVLVMLALGVVVTSRNWIGARLGGSLTPQTGAGLQDANRAFETGDINAAINIARQLWATQPEKSDSLLLLVRALMYRSYADYNRDIDREVALQLTTDAIKRYPDLPDVMIAHALALQLNDEPVLAWNMARAVLNLYPDRIPARVALARAYLGAGGYENALNESLALLADAGEWKLDALYTAAASLSRMGRYRDAIEMLEEAIQINHKLPALYFDQANNALKLGDTDTASVAYFRILTFFPDNIKVRLRMCEISHLLENDPAALEYCREVTERAPGWLAGWHMRGKIDFMQGNFAAAQTAFRRCTALAISQNIPIAERPFECWYLQGQAAEILGDCDSLMQIYREFQAMAAEAALPQTWTYPPEGPPICATLAPEH